MFDHYGDFEYLLARIQLVLFMLGMGATLRPADFVDVLVFPRFLIIGLVCQFLVAPLLAVLLGWWWNLEPGIAVGLVLVSALPGGQMSKLFTFYARGNVALSITLTAVGTLGSLVTVPVLIQLLAGHHLEGNRFEMPAGRVISDVATYLLLPLACGMTVGRFMPSRRIVFSKTCIRLGLVFVAVMICGSAASGQIQITSYGWTAPLAIIVYCVAAMQLSLLPFRLLGWSKPDTVAVGIEVTMRNMNLALLLKSLLFQADDPVGHGVLFVILFYGGTALVAALPLAWRYRRMAGHAARRQSET